MDTPRYTTGMIYHNGFLYMAANNDAKAQIIKFDTQTQKIVGTTDVTHMMGTASYLNNLSILGDGDLLIAGVNSNKTEGCIDNYFVSLRGRVRPWQSPFILHSNIARFLP